MPSIREIARVCSVSPMTVSFVLNNKPGQVSDETRDRVLSVVREMGYRPRATKVRGSQHVNTLGVAIGVGGRGDSDTGYYQTILASIMAAADRQSQNLTIFASSLFSEDPANSIRTYCDGRCDGLVIIAPGPGNPLVAALHERGVPFVIVGDTSATEMSSVDVDNVSAARAITTHLLDLGHRRIGFLGFPGRFVQSAEERLAGYREALTNYGLAIDPKYVINDEWRDRDILDALTAVFRRPAAERPTALVCWNDGMALRSLLLLQDLGLRIPHDVSITGFDNEQITQATTPPLTTFRQPYAEIGARAVEILIGQIESQPDQRKMPRLLLAGDLVVRQSTAAPLGAEPTESRHVRKPHSAKPIRKTAWSGDIRPPTALLRKRR